MHKKVLEYFVVGAGPAGIAAVGKLIDLSLDPKKIGWIDTHFAVGDLGRKWLNVSSNNKVDLFIKFLLECKSFHFDPHAKDFSINFIPKENTCLLKEVVYPLQWVTKQLMQKVNTYLGLARCLHLENGVWHINTENEEILSKNVILAIGCDAKRLDHGGLLEIPLDIALNPEILPQHVIKDDTVAVFGSSHSAIPILANLLNLGVKVINFYRSPHLYAVDMGDWTLFDTSGLKGFSADWAKKNLDGKMPSRLERFFSTDKTLHEHLARCNKAVYSIGFKRRNLPILKQYDDFDYNNKTGIIAPGLFGFGIAFPEEVYDHFMNHEHRVGLWKFMEYLNKVLPIWMKYGN